MDQDNSQKDPQDTTQGGGTPQQDQPVEPTEAPAAETAPEAAPEAAPAEEKPAEAPAEEPVAEPAPETPAEAPAEEPVAEPAPEAAPEEPAAEAKPAPEAPAQEPAQEPAAEAKPEVAPVEEKPAEPTPAPEATPEAEAAPAEESAPTAEPAATPEAPKTEATSDDCGCPSVNEAEWDKQKKTIDKAFYKTWSPRLFHYPFSFAIDMGRAKQGALNKKYTVPENGMILDTGGMFWSTVLVEIEGENAEDKDVISLRGKEVYTKVSKKPWSELGSEIEELKKELGKEPSELYFWYTACPKCIDKKEVKTVLIAVQ